MNTNGNGFRCFDNPKPFPVHTQRGSAGDDATEPFGREGAGCVCAQRHRAGGAAEETPEAINNNLVELVD